MPQTVLIADDNELNLQLFTDLLELKKIRVIAVAEGSKVIENAIKHKPDLIITDIRLGQVSGIKLVEDIKAQDEIASIPIIAITAYVTDHDKVKLQKIGCNHYLSKPVPIEQFYSVVGEYLKL